MQLTEMVAALQRNDWNGTSDLPGLITSIFTSSEGSINIRKNLDRVIAILKHDNFPNHVRIDIIPTLLSQMNSAQQGTSEEQIIELKLTLATALENAEDFEEAVQTLMSIPLSSSQRQMSSNEKGDILIRIMRLHLELGDSTTAETYLNRFKQIMHEVTDPKSQLYFAFTQARINDSNRDFLAAAQGYHDLSRHELMTVDEEVVQTLAGAVKCAVLAPAGPARSKVLKRLYDDERAAALPNYKILENMLLSRLISPADAAAFAETLDEHQTAKMSDGLTVFQKAMFEHNLLAVSKVYANIQLSRLGELLGVDEIRAEEMAAKMIQQGRLLGRIDGVEGWIFFEQGEATGTQSVAGSGGGKIREWDANVEALTKDMEGVFVMIQERRPGWVEQNLVIEGR